METTQQTGTFTPEQTALDIARSDVASALGILAVVAARNAARRARMAARS